MEEYIVAMVIISDGVLTAHYNKCYTVQYPEKKTINKILTKIPANRLMAPEYTGPIIGQ